MEPITFVYISGLLGVIALIFAGYLALNVKKEEIGTPEMKEISDAIHSGAMIFLNREYKYLVILSACYEDDVIIFDKYILVQVAAIDKPLEIDRKHPVSPRHVGHLENS